MLNVAMDYSDGRVSMSALAKLKILSAAWLFASGLVLLKKFVFYNYYAYDKYYYRNH